MSEFWFKPAERPFPRWMGPYSPARGDRCGFRFHQKRLGVWVSDNDFQSFWPISYSPGISSIMRIVGDVWGGGRVLFLPNGYLVKPLPGEDERGQRVYLGQWGGSIVLEKPDGEIFDLSQPGVFNPGDLWPGPKTIGLEATLGIDGKLACKWNHPSPTGNDFVRAVRSDRILGEGMGKARPSVMGGRVRITANGHVITNKRDCRSAWSTHYVGWIDPSSWKEWKHWIRREDL